MSHFSTIKTKIKSKPQLVEALELLQYNVTEDKELRVTGSHGIKHEVVEAEVAISNDIGFRMNPHTGDYELVADLETWKQPIPVDRRQTPIKLNPTKVTSINSEPDDRLNIYNILLLSRLILLK